MFMKLVKLEFKLRRWAFRRLNANLSSYYTKYLFVVNNVQYGINLTSKGIPIVDVSTRSAISIGDNFRLNNGNRFNRIGRQQPCYLIADKGGKINIGNNVGMSGTAIICQKKITIGNNVRIGGNTVIYDSDFHDLCFEKRTSIPEQIGGVLTKPVTVEDNVFIGGHVTILKGVTIGSNSIIGAGSVVSKDIPANQIWAGNPATFVRKINNKFVVDKISF